MIDRTHWEAMKARAGRLLPPDFSRSVIAHTAAVRQRRSQIRIAACTLAICLLSTGGVSIWMNHQQTRQNLADWQEYAQVTRAMVLSL